MILETKVVQSQISPDGGLRLTSVCLFGVVDMKPCRIFCSPSVKSEGTTCPKECLHHCWERHVYLFLSSQWGENHEFSLQPSAAAGMSVGSMCWSFHRKNKVFNVSYNRSYTVKIIVSKKTNRVLREVHPQKPQSLSYSNAFICLYKKV